MTIKKITTTLPMSDVFADVEAMRAHIGDRLSVFVRAMEELRAEEERRNAAQDV